MPLTLAERWNTRAEKYRRGVEKVYKQKLKLLKLGVDQYAGWGATGEEYGDAENGVEEFGLDGGDGGVDGLGLSGVGLGGGSESEEDEDELGRGGSVGHYATSIELEMEREQQERERVRKREFAERLHIVRER
jgi:hypothetical protein